ncbi:anaphase-promoting complex subunit 4 [Bacillus rossius redtenbacheri]|uniref:anaphase-promoting complex subunit 4 n=1 Tax=Bacillus rossius redtenbacheri TaxID=93214 RepID=UPI002FDD3936
MSSSNPMRQLEERHVAIKVEQMAWSDKMDLLALANVRGEVALHRLTWQKVWMLPPPQDGVRVAALAWRPDGKIIAIAYSSNDVLLIDVEDKRTVYKNHIDGDITYMSWKHEGSTPDAAASSSAGSTEPFEKYEEFDNSKDFLPKLPPLVRSFEQEELQNDVKKMKAPASLNILVVGTSNGKLSLSIFGMFPCGLMDMAGCLPGQQASVVGAEFTRRLDGLFVVLALGRGERRDLAVVRLQTRVFLERSAELQALALKHGHIVDLLGYASQTMHAITEAWENILLEMDSKLASYASKVPGGFVSADFLELLMFGSASSELEHFLLQELTEKGLKKLGHSIELSYSNIQKMVLKHLHAVGQDLSYHLAEMKGMAGYLDRYEPLGLQEEMVTAALSAAGSFLVKATEVQQVIDSSMKNYKAFFRWLYVAILRLTDDRVLSDITKVNQTEIAYIAEFLYGFDGEGARQRGVFAPQHPSRPHFNLERLGQYLADRELVTPPATDDNPWTKLLRDNPSLSGYPAIIPHHREKSLVQQHAHLREAIALVFSQPEHCIGSLLEVSHVLVCASVFECRDERIQPAHVTTGKDDRLVLAFPDSLPPAPGMYLLELPAESSEPEQPKCVHVNFTSSPDREASLKILDLQFYLPDVLSILLERVAESRGSVFVQFPTAVAASQGTAVSACPARSARPSPGAALVSLAEVPHVDGGALLEPGAMRVVENMVSSRLAVSGSRKLAVVLSESRRKVRLFEMEAEDEEEDEEGMDTTVSSTDGPRSSALEED